MKDWKALAAAKKNLVSVGEPDTEFEKAGSLGPFECGNCVHQVGGACFHPDMMKHSKQPKNEDGSVKVGHGDCCRYVRRKGE